MSEDEGKKRNNVVQLIPKNARPVEIEADEDDGGESGSGDLGELNLGDARYDVSAEALQAVRQQIRSEVIAQGIAGQGQELPEAGPPGEGSSLEQHPMSQLFTGMNEKTLKTIDINTIDANNLSPELKLRLEQKLGKQLQSSAAPSFKPI